MHPGVNLLQECRSGPTRRSGSALAAAFWNQAVNQWFTFLIF
jgi:hypothetical protein